MSTAYEYASLQPGEIRLLVLHHGQYSDTLGGSILVEQHSPEKSSVPHYEALSYTWGDQTDPDYIHIAACISPCPSSQAEPNKRSGTISSGKLAIGRNLSEALRYLRHETERRVLWCDSICINQQDLDERAAQVQVMGSIYKNARRVVAWLGLPDEQSRLAIRTLRKFADSIDFSHDEEALQANKINLKEEDASLANDFEKPGLLSPEEWEALESLISRSWFRRVWVRQEILLAGPDSVIVAGSDSIPWQHFLGAFRLFLALRGTPQSLNPLQLSGQNFNVQSFVYMGHLKDIFSLLAYTHNCDATDPRDRIYGLLGIMSEEMAKGIHVDYNKDVKELFRDAFIKGTQWSQELKLLSFCNSATEPTWIPDFHRVQAMRPIFTGQSGLASDVEGKTIDPARIVFQGIHCDIITELIGRSGLQETSQEEALQIIIQGATYFLGPDPDVWEEERVKVFFLAALVNDVHLYSSHADGLKSCLASGVRGEDAFPEMQGLQFTYFLAGRSLYKTRMGYITLGPKGCEPGDIVCVFLGSHRPTILSPASNGEYRVKGAATHPALYFGEALLGELPKGWRLRYTTLTLAPIFESPDGNQQRVDPRLDGIHVPEGKELRWRHNGTPYWYTAETDRWTDLDPRATMGELLNRGVRIEGFTLI